MIILVISDHPKYHGFIGTLKITVYFGSTYPKECHPRLASQSIAVYYIKGSRPISLPSIILGSKISQGFVPYLYCHVPRSATSIKKYTLFRIISYEMASTIKVSRYLISLKYYMLRSILAHRLDMPKQAICQSNSCCRHPISVNAQGG